MNFSEIPHPLTTRLKRHQIATESGDVVWYELGSGTPLLLLHGGFGNHLHWEKNIEFFAQKYRVLIPDMPGFGESDKAPEHTIESLLIPFLSSLHQLVKADELIDVVCFSFGGLVGSQLVLSRGHVGRLAILGAVGHHVERRPRGELINWKDAYAKHDLTALHDCMRHNLLMHMIYDESVIDDNAVDIQTRACTSCRFKSREISWSGGLFEKLEKIQQSTTTQIILIWGEFDVTGDPSLLAEITLMRLPNVRARVMFGAGHWIQYEKADEVNELLSEWLTLPNFKTN